MVLTEILQNALEHGFGQGDRGTVEVSRGPRRQPTEARLLVTVQDDGIGLPEGFDPHRAGNLGLQIVRTLVEGELGGTFDMVRAPERGTQVILDMPVRARRSSTAEPAPLRAHGDTSGRGPRVAGQH